MTRREGRVRHPGQRPSTTRDVDDSGCRLLTGVTHMLPKAVYGYLQSKAIYPTQDQILDVAREYRQKKLPLDVLVVDFLNMTKQGELDLDPKRWPDPAAMNRELNAMGVKTLLSVWPHFAAGTQFWTNQRLHGGQTIEADAPIDTLPLFVRAGSIVPLGSEIESTTEPQTITSVRVYPGADASFTLFQDDSTTYGYEKGAGSLSKLTWDDKSRRLYHEGAPAWSGPDTSVVTVVSQ